MIRSWRYGDEARREDAAGWVVRLEAGDLGDAEAVAFDAWLADGPENAIAFDAALATSQAFAAAGPAVVRELSRYRAPARTAHLDRGRRAVMGLGAAAAAAVVAVIVAPQLAGPEAQTFVTAKGERRAVRLADVGSSRVDLQACKLEYSIVSPK